MSSDLAEIFSRKLRAGSLGGAPLRREIAANAAECAALAAMFGIPGIAALTGDYALSPAPGRKSGIVEAELLLRAKITQICVVSLEPFDSVVTERARLTFVPAASLTEDSEIAELSPETLEGPDELAYTGDSIDLGGALAEQLALALDPYPRKPGAELPAAARDAADNPFAALALRGTSAGTDPANDPE